MAKKLSLFTLTFISLGLLFSNEASAIMVDQESVYCDQQVIERMLEGDIIRQEFKSTTDQFGIVAVKFSNFQMISNDSLIFRIKEKNSEDWLFEHTYKVDQMQNDQYFTFGVPPMTNIQGKSYVFELESLSGLPEDSIGVYFCKNSSDIVFKLVQGIQAKEKLKMDLSKIISSDPIFWILWLIFLTIPAYYLRKSS